MKKLSWRNAFAEVFFIFIGITLAIAFQNWNDERKERKLEISVLKELQIALKNDLEDINANINTHLKGERNCKALLRGLSSDQPIDGDELLLRAVDATDFTFLISDVSAYEYLKSVGLHLFENDTLRSQISYVYDVVYESIRGLEDNGDATQEALLNRLKLYYTADENNFRMIGIPDRIKKDNQLRFDIKAMEYIHSIMIGRYQRKVKPQVKKLITMVNQELENK
ncbi:MAG: DUF6090 family protein [Bacteroidota bacterium]